ncbi:mycothiol transferase [Brachybacterium sp. AOP43-C2-M15]|uniref:mycothiol transferase n=1 Tax=Brachybacterium sp. AOP43-C2-M15 TaxID=3457661 RepID=UPI004033F50E
MPFLTPETTEERDTLATFAAQQIRQVATALHGLTDEQLRQTPTASAMSLGALARHVLLIAEGGTAAIAAAPEAGPTPDRAPEQLQAEGMVAPDALRAEDTPESLVEELHGAADRLAIAIREADPDGDGPFDGAPWWDGRSRWTTRWYALHQVEEFARHAGHADILRESIDGRGTYELNALADGQEWPPAGW